MRMDDSLEVQEICTHDGVLLLKAPDAFAKEINCTGALTLFRIADEVNRRHYVEWKPFDPDLIADHDGHEQGDWSFVDAIARRQRTASESIIFNTSSNSIQSPEKSPKNRILHTELNVLRFIEVRRNGTSVRFIRRSDSSIHSEYFFQHGNADGFVRTLQTSAFLQRTMSLNRILYEVVDSIDTDDSKLKQTFSELDINDIKGNRGWLSNYVKNPFGQTMEFFAKVSDVRTIIPVGSETTASNDLVDSVNEKNGDDEISILGTSAPADDYIVLEDKGYSEDWVKRAEDMIPMRPRAARGQPLSEEQWKSFKSEDGVIKDPDAIKRIIFRGGVASNLRKEVWKYLLVYYKWEHTNAERETYVAEKRRVYYEMKLQWLLVNPAQEANFSAYRDARCQIEKDVKRTDRVLDYFAGDDNPNLVVLEHILMTYMMFHFDLGYSQGMSDLLSPILILMDDEVDAFWCFVGFMDMMQNNFDANQTGMKHQLLNLNKLTKFITPRLYSYFHQRDSDNMYFCFRWMLVWFKREFELEQIMELWEVLWTELPSLNFHLFITLAALDIQLPVFLSNNFDFSEILKYVNELTCKMCLKTILTQAEAIYLQLISIRELPAEICEIIGDTVPENEPSSDDEEDLQFTSAMATSVRDIEKQAEWLCEALAVAFPKFNANKR